MAYDLRYENWIPWRRRSGKVEWGPPSLVVDGVEDGDPVVGLSSPRPDFTGALQEFLIGLLSAALSPADEREWSMLSETPPPLDVLRSALDRLPPAFDLEGDGPRFFQDLSQSDCAEGGHWTIESLLIGTPNTGAGDAGTRTIINDLFVKPGRIERFGRPAAAMAILTMQTYAPAGGQGHRTSLRGGGPLTTLVEPRVGRDGQSLSAEQPLWQKLWANVETLEQLRDRSVPGAPTAVRAAFPWLLSTRTSNEKAGGRPTHAATAHPLEAYFGLPRRIRLEFGEAGVCDLTGLPDERTVVGFWMRNYGAQYVDWKHPLTPHYRQKVTEPWLPLHGQPGGIGWRDWVGLTLRAPEGGLREAAAVVPAYTRRTAGRRGKALRLHAFGYDMDNMKARGWTEATVPLFVVDGVARQSLLRETATQLAEATGIASSALLYAIKAARFNNPKEITGDIGFVRGELWDATEPEFYGEMAGLASTVVDEDAAIEADRCRANFIDILRREALAVFDRWCPTPSLSPESLRRRVVARNELASTLGGYSKLGEKLFMQLGVPLPGGGRSARAAKKPSRKETTT